MTVFLFEEEEYVCKSCGGADWQANVFFRNSKKRWQEDYDADLHYILCADCDGPTDITPLKEYEEEDEE
tara:strand:- start:447 stop:653 length:207 start_codon:yes stop_codon:yes gene_type:complete